MADTEKAEVTAVRRLEDSPLTLQEQRPDILRSVGAPCSVIQASYRLGRPATPLTAAWLDEVKNQLRAKGVRLGQVEMPPPKGPPEPSAPCGPAEVVVQTTGERFVAPFVDYWELSVPVVIVLLYVQVPVERLAPLVGKRITIRQLSTAPPNHPLQM